MWLPLIAILSFLLIYVILKKIKSNKDKILQAMQAIKERKEDKKEEKKETAKKKISRVWTETVVILIILAAIGWFGYRYFSEYDYRRDQRPITMAQQEWQLCWMKKPEYEGKTDIRQKCLPAQIEKRSDSHIVISYSFSGGKGIREGTSTDGKNYSGQWKDKTGWGNFSMTFVSLDTAFGWSDDKGTGDKQPSVFERK